MEYMELAIYDLEERVNKALVELSGNTVSLGVALFPVSADAIEMVEEKKKPK